jgi:hypothetical protein
MHNPYRRAKQTAELIGSVGGIAEEAYSVLRKGTVVGPRVRVVIGGCHIQRTACDEEGSDVSAAFLI